MIGLCAYQPLVPKPAAVSPARRECGNGLDWGLRLTALDADAAEAVTPPINQFSLSTSSSPQGVFYDNRRPANDLQATQN